MCCLPNFLAVVLTSMFKYLCPSQKQVCAEASCRDDGRHGGILKPIKHGTHEVLELKIEHDGVVCDILGGLLN